MSVLFWDKPAKKMSVQAWKDDVGFEDGPTGGYQPNMSETDAQRWKAKVTGTRTGFPQVEIRKTCSLGTSQIVIIVNLGAGYNYKYYHAIDDRYFGKKPSDFPPGYYTQKEIDEHSFPTRGINVHIALNGPAQLSFQEMQEMNQAVEEAKAYLEKNFPAKPE